MCGIAGVFAYGRGSGMVDRDSLARSCDVMAARGPDGQGQWFSSDGKVGLGHRRLAIIDLSPSGAQPMAYAEAGLHLTFNGEIYNYRELKAGLESAGHEFRSGSDSEVLLHLYEEHGEQMCEKLRGMFAFAIWDERKKGLFLARDQFGIKPLFIGRAPSCVFFASQVKAIVASGVVPSGPDPAGHVGFFLWGNMPEPHTLHKNIRELPAGHSTWVDEHGLREPRAFFDLATELEELEGTAMSASQDEAQERFREACLDSVRHHFVADVPVGVFLSAGRDSTTLLALSSEVNEQAPNSITLGFEEYEGSDSDEVPLAKLVADQYCSRHLCKRVLGNHFREDLPKILQAMDQPSVDGLNTYYVSQVTREFNMKVALSGLGGDEMLGGYPSFDQIPKLVSTLKAGRSLPWLGKAFRILTSSLMTRMTSPKYAGLLEYGPTFGGAYLLRRGLFMPWELPRVLDPELVQQGWAELLPVIRIDNSIVPLKSDRAKVAAMELANYMRCRLLRDSDWAGMAHSIEIRVPFVDVEFFRAVAPYMGTAAQLEKHNLALTPLRPLPEAVVNRPKTGFTVPVREWLMGELPEAGSERSLRGWARIVHKAQSAGVAEARA